jgi:hypothetical protein
VVVQYRKNIPEGESGTAETELREIMGDYWLTPDEIASLRASK